MKHYRCYAYQKPTRLVISRCGRRVTWAKSTDTPAEVECKACRADLERRCLLDVAPGATIEDMAKRDRNTLNIDFGELLAQLEKESKNWAKKEGVDESTGAYVKMLVKTNPKRKRYS